MTSTRAVFLEAAGGALELIGRQEVAERWDAPSALAGMTTGAVAAHLARQVHRVPEVLSFSPSGEPPVDLVEHYLRSAWVNSGPDDEPNVDIRDRATQGAAIGPAEVLLRAQEVLAGLRTTLPAEPLDRVVRMPWAGWDLTLEDFLRSRLLEIVVHSDDLAVSAGIEPPAWPEDVVAPVLGLLTSLAVRKHGAPAVLRTLARRERAPLTIAAI